MRRLDNKVAGITGRSIEFSGARRDFVKTVGIVAGGSLLPSSFTRVQAAGKEASHGDGPSQAQRALKIVMVPKFTGTPCRFVSSGVPPTAAMVLAVAPT